MSLARVDRPRGARPWCVCVCQKVRKESPVSARAHIRPDSCVFTAPHITIVSISKHKPFAHDSRADHTPTSRS